MYFPHFRVQHDLQHPSPLFFLLWDGGWGMAAAGDFSEGIMTNVSSSRRLAHRPLYSLDKMIGVLRRSTENFNYRQKEREADECVLFFFNNQLPLFYHLQKWSAHDVQLVARTKRLNGWLVYLAAISYYGGRRRKPKYPEKTSDVQLKSSNKSFVV